MRTAKSAWGLRKRTCGLKRVKYSDIVIKVLLYVRRHPMTTNMAISQAMKVSSSYILETLNALMRRKLIMRSLLHIHRNDVGYGYQITEKGLKKVSYDLDSL